LVSLDFDAGDIDSKIVEGGDMGGAKRITFRARKIGDFTKLLILIGDSRLGLASRYTRRGHLSPHLITRAE
jgi:hypothetical protein